MTARMEQRVEALEASAYRAAHELDEMDARFGRSIAALTSELKNQGVMLAALAVDTRDFRIETNNRLDRVEQRLGGIDQRLDSMDKRLGGIDQRLDSMDKRFDGIDQRLDSMDNRLEGMQGILLAVARQVGVPAAGMPREATH